MTHHSKTLARYLSYPTLEGILRSVVPQIGMDGIIKSNQKITGRKEILYEGQRCNSIVDLLHHLEEQSAPKLSKKLEQIRIEFADFYKVKEEDGFAEIYYRRNSYLHGEEQAKAEFGVIYNLICLIIWQLILEKVRE